MRGKFFVYIFAGALTSSVNMQPSAALAAPTKIGRFTCALTLSVLAGCNSYVLIGRPQNMDLVTTASPGGWTGFASGIRVDPLKNSSLVEVRQVAREFINTYPEGFVDRYVDRICFGDRCYRSGKGQADVGGFFTPMQSTTLYINHSKMDFDRSTLHHEFAHLLEHQQGSREFKEVWTRNSSYTNLSYNDYLKSPGAHEENSDRLYREGFVSTYAQRNFDEDFAETVEAMFAGLIPWDRLDSFPLLKQKVRLVIFFYKTLDPSLNEEFFRAKSPESKSLWRQIFGS